MGSALIPLYLVALALSAAITYGMVHWSWRWGLVDQPGEHRSHDTVTPRGGGIGIAAALVAVLAAFAGADELLSIQFLLALLAGVMLVAGIGLADDRLALPAWPRLLVHLLVAGAIAWTGLPGGDWLAIAIVALGIAWAINLHNFMDGSNGLLAGHAAIVLATLAYAATFDLLVAGLCGAAAAAALGFLPFNFPRARIFLGDVGSGVLGLAIGVGIWQAHERAVMLLPAGLVLASGFLFDATATLVVRIVRRERFAQRHREHLYQWLVRSGWSHTAVALAYWAWTAACAGIALFLMRPLGLHMQWNVALVVLAAATAIMAFAKLALRRRLREP
ncbi:MAG TPA: hypothetical protein VFL14_00580 [Xanthomonadales bacterium]|nr:hypothetical protein [Xanthomonadales bacterium]